MVVLEILDDDGLNSLLNEPASGALVNFLEHTTLRACGGLYLFSEAGDMGATPLNHFITRVLYYSQIPFNVVPAVSVYLSRLGCCLGPGRRGSSSTPYRMFFGCLILTAKYLLDEPPSISSWIRCLTFSCNNLFFTKTEILNLELDILKECQWRADIHEHDLLQELEMLANFLGVASQPASGHMSGHYPRTLSMRTGQQLRQINSYIEQIRQLSLQHPCLLCPSTVSIDEDVSLEIRIRTTLGTELESA